MFLQGALIGVFISMDLVVFYFFWEAVLIPAYFMIGSYGGGAGSTPPSSMCSIPWSAVLMLVGILALYASGANSFDLLALINPSTRSRRKCSVRFPGLRAGIRYQVGHISIS